MCLSSLVKQCSLLLYGCNYLIATIALSIAQTVIIWFDPYVHSVDGIWLSLCNKQAMAMAMEMFWNCAFFHCETFFGFGLFDENDIKYSCW